MDILDHDLICNLLYFFLTSALAWTWQKYLRLRKRVERENKEIRAGLQALLRDRMIRTYNRFYEGKGYMPIYARESFLATYNSYHNLGENGVMDDIKEKILTLPTAPPNERDD